VLDSLLARPRALFGSCVLAGVAVLTIHPSWAQSIGADVWNVPALNKQVRASAVEEDRLTSEDDDILHRIAIKESIITALIDRRITLADATAQFMELNSARPEYMTALRNAFPGETDLEKVARNVIAFALPRVPLSEREALSVRLEAELQQVLAGSAH
jgi:hypothetical protein